MQVRKKINNFVSRKRRGTRSEEKEVKYFCFLIKKKTEKQFFHSERNLSIDHDNKAFIILLYISILQENKDWERVIFYR